MAPLLGLPGLLDEIGVDFARVIAEAGLDAALFEDPENTVAFVDAGRLLAICAERTACPHIGLVVGERYGTEVLGLVGELARCCPDVGSALRNIVVYLHLHDRGAVPALWVSGDRAMLAYVIHQPEVPGTEVIYDLALAVTHNIVRELAGEDWHPLEVCLCRRPPAEIRPYKQCFRTSLRFGAEHTAVVFSTACLNRRLDGADALIQTRIMRDIEALEELGSGDLASRLRDLLRRMLLNGTCKGETSLEQVSRAFAIHRRTLNRRLRSQGTSFRALVDEARYEIACHLLRDTRLPVLEVAVTLGYADAASFTRAFRRWCATAPAQWRETHTPT
jgi:AraC-like DNA-binding protein